MRELGFDRDRSAMPQTDDTPTRLVIAVGTPASALAISVGRDQQAAYSIDPVSALG